MFPFKPPFILGFPACHVWLPVVIPYIYTMGIPYSPGSQVEWASYSLTQDATGKFIMRFPVKMSRVNPPHSQTDPNIIVFLIYIYIHIFYIIIVHIYLISNIFIYIHISIPFYSNDTVSPPIDSELLPFGINLRWWSLAMWRNRCWSKDPWVMWWGKLCRCGKSMVSRSENGLLMVGVQK